MNYLNKINRNGNAIIFYDGECALCSIAVVFILNRDHQQKFKYAPLSGETAKKMLNSHVISNADSLVVHTDGAIFLYSNAVIFIAQNLIWPYKAIAILKILPLRMRDYIYKILANNRHLILKKSVNCQLTGKPKKDLFLN